MTSVATVRSSSPSVSNSIPFKYSEHPDAPSKTGSLQSDASSCLRQGKFDFALPVIEVREIRAGRVDSEKRLRPERTSIRSPPAARQFPRLQADHGRYQRISRRNGRRSWLVWLNQRNTCHISISRSVPVSDNVPSATCNRDYRESVA